MQKAGDYYNLVVFIVDTHAVVVFDDSPKHLTQPEHHLETRIMTQALISD